MLFRSCRHRIDAAGYQPVGCGACGCPCAGDRRIAWTVSRAEVGGRTCIVSHGALEGGGVDLEGLAAGERRAEVREVAGKSYFLFNVGDCRVLATRCRTQICVFVVRRNEIDDVWKLAAAITHDR